MTAPALIGEGKQVTISTDVDRGTYIAPDDLENVLGIARDDNRYGLELLRMCEAFHAETAKAGDPKLIRREDCGLRIMTDSEAADYTERMFRARLWQAEQTHERGVAAVRCDQLTEEQRGQNDRKASIRSRIVQAVHSAIESTTERAALMPAKE